VQNKKELSAQQKAGRTSLPFFMGAVEFQMLLWYDVI
jgi:hypothetical protein